MRTTPDPRDDAGQTSAFVVKLVVTLAVLGFLVIDLGGPMITRMQVDHDSLDAMKDAAKTYDTTLGNVGAAQARLETELAGTGITVKSVELVSSGATTPTGARSTTQGLLRATFEKDASTLLLGKLPPLRDWYHVEITAETEVR